MRKIILTFLLLLPIFVMNIEAKTFKENDVIEEKKDEKVQGWSIEDGKTYYVDEIGHRVIGIKKINNEYYYFENDGSLCCTQKWKYIDNQWYLVKANGMLKIGWYHNEEGWHYFNSEGQMLTGWQEIDGNTYLFTDKGVITTGWRNQNGWRYFNEQGHMYLGWKYVSGEKYYFNYRGYITIGINEIGNELYYFNEQGHLNKQEKWRKINGEWYFIKSDGRLKIGWYHNEEGWHYFNSEGQMLTGWQEINGNTYLFTDKGIITTGWHSSDSNLYYFNKDGHMCKGSKTIDQRKYYFNTSNGELMSMTAPIPYYMQTDSRWANKKYGSGTMASTGCAQTCAAMAFSFLKNQTILPPDVASWGYKNGYYNGKVTGTIGSFWPAISKHYGIACQGNLTVDQAIDALRHGKLVVAGMNPPNFTFEGTTHEIIIYGIDENNMVSVYGPYFKSHNKKYSIKQIFKEKSTDKGDCTSGGPIFALG